MKIIGFTRDRLNAYDIEDLGTSLFSLEIRNFSLPEEFSVPRFVLYDGTSNLVAHLRHFYSENVDVGRHRPPELQSFLL